MAYVDPVGENRWSAGSVSPSDSRATVRTPSVSRPTLITYSGTPNGQSAGQAVERKSRTGYSGVRRHAGGSAHLDDHRHATHRYACKGYLCARGERDPITQ